MVHERQYARSTKLDHHGSRSPRACGQLLAAPEEHVRNLRALLALTADDDGPVRRLAQLSLLAVLRDIMPGYRIRLPSEKELAMPVSKDVKKVRDYESTLLRLYQVRAAKPPFPSRPRVSGPPFPSKYCLSHLSGPSKGR